MKCTLSIDVTDATLDEISRIAEAIKTFNAKQDTKESDALLDPPLYLDGVTYNEEDPDDGDKKDLLPDEATVARIFRVGVKTVRGWRNRVVYDAYLTLDHYARLGFTVDTPALTVAEVAQLAKQSESQVYKALGRGEVETPLNFGKHSPIRISYRAAQEWAEKVNAEPTTAPSEELPLNNNTTKEN